MLPLFDQDFLQEHHTLQSSFATLSNDEEQTKLHLFQAIIKHYHTHKRRTFPWREHITPYHVVVSEIMLQQTQTDRVIGKFELFTTQFPDFQALATAPFHDVLRFWKGLGYNRRAMALQKIAQIVVADHDGKLPAIPEVLETFPGIGKATARSIVAFAFNQPTAFIETNIRTVFIYFFFKNRTDVHDKELEPLISKTVDLKNPREWYYALMDYGVMLKKTVGNVSRLSSHYTKQSKFQGSDRQIRGMILQILLDQPGIKQTQLVAMLNKDEQRVSKIVHDLCAEGFACNHNGALVLKEQ